jgi:pimeloyl-ACP methyl ester carboxylesterase
MLLHTEIFGEGEPILFLHTGLQTGLTDFEHQRNHFQEKYKVILPDLRGQGKSNNSDFSNYYEDCATDLVETLDYYNLEKVHLVGCSLGALVGIKFAKRFPERIKTLTLSGIMAEKPINWTEIHNEQVAQQAEFLKNEKAVKFFDNLHQADWKQFIYMGEKEDWYPFEENRDVSSFTFPTLIMVGEENKYEAKGAIIYPDINQLIHISVIPFASHLVHSQQPEIYTRTLEEFIRKSS